MELKVVTYFVTKRSIMFDLILNTPLMTTFAIYWQSISNKSKIVFRFCLFLTMAVPRKFNDGPIEKKCLAWKIYRVTYPDRMKWRFEYVDRAFSYPFHTTAPLYFQKQPSRGVLRKRCSENMQQINRRTLMPKCDFSKVAKQLFWNRTSTWVFSFIFAAYFQNTFL